MRRTLRKSEILRGRKSFEHVFQYGRKTEGRVLRCLVADDGPVITAGISKILFAVIVSRNVKRAVNRNRIKRLIRESYRLHKELIHQHVERLSQPIVLLFIYSAKKGNEHSIPTFREIEKDMIHILASIVRIHIEKLA